MRKKIPIIRNISDRLSSLTNRELREVVQDYLSDTKIPIADRRLFVKRVDLINKKTKKLEVWPGHYINESHLIKIGSYELEALFPSIIEIAFDCGGELIEIINEVQDFTLSIGQDTSHIWKGKRGKGLMASILTLAGFTFKTTAFKEGEKRTTKRVLQVISELGQYTVEQRTVMASNKYDKLTSREIKSLEELI